MFERISNTLRSAGIKIVSKAAVTIGSLFSKLKDPIPKRFQTHVCYKITCACSKLYIGQTKQHLETRFHQHRTGNSNNSSMSSHIVDDNCSINFEDMKILCKESNLHARRVREAIFIRKFEDKINIQSDNFHLGHQYDNLI